MPGENEIEIIIRAQNQFSSELQKLVQEVQGLSGAFSGFEQKLGTVQSALTALTQQYRTHAAAAKEQSAAAVKEIDSQAEAYKRLKAAKGETGAVAPAAVPTPSRAETLAALQKSNPQYEYLLYIQKQTQRQIAAFTPTATGEVANSSVPQKMAQGLIAQAETRLKDYAAQIAAIEGPALEAVNKRAAAENTVNDARTRGLALAKEEAARQQDLATVAQAQAQMAQQASRIQQFQPLPNPVPENIRGNAAATQAWARSSKFGDERTAQIQAYQISQEKAKALEDELVRRATALGKNVTTSSGGVNESAMRAWVASKEGAAQLEQAMALLEERYAGVAAGERLAANSAAVFTKEFAAQQIAASQLVGVLDTVLQKKTQEAAVAKQAADEAARARAENEQANAKIIEIENQRIAKIEAEKRARKELQDAANAAAKQIIAEQDAQRKAAVPPPVGPAGPQLPLFPGDARYDKRLATAAAGTQGELPGLGAADIQVMNEQNAQAERMRKARILLQTEIQKTPGLDPEEFLRSAAAAGGLVDQLEKTGVKIDDLAKKPDFLGRLVQDFNALTQQLSTVIPGFGQLVSIIRTFVNISAGAGGLALLGLQLKNYVERVDEAVRATVTYNRAIEGINAAPMLQSANAISTELDVINEKFNRGVLSVAFWQQQVANYFSKIVNNATPAELAMEKLGLAAKKFNEGMPGFTQKEALSGQERMANLRASEARYTLYEVQGLETLKAVQSEITGNYAKAHEARLAQIKLENDAAIKAAQRRWDVDAQGRSRNADPTMAYEAEASYRNELHLIEMRTTQARELSTAEQAAANQRRERMIEARRREITLQPIEADLKISKSSLQGLQAELQMLQQNLAETATSAVGGMLKRMEGITATIGRRNVEMIRMQADLQVARLQRPNTADELFRTGKYTERGAEARARLEQGDYMRAVELIRKIQAADEAAAEAESKTRIDASKKQTAAVLRDRANLSAQEIIEAVKTNATLAASDRQRATARIQYATPENYEEIIASINEAAEAEHAWKERAIVEEFKAAWNAEVLWDKRKKLADDFYNNLKKHRATVAVDEQARGQQAEQITQKQIIVENQRLLARAQVEQQIAGIREQVSRTRLQEAGPSNWQQELAAAQAESAAGADAQYRAMFRTLDVALQQAAVIEDRVKAEKDERDAWIAFNNQYDIWLNQQIARVQQLEALARDTRKKFEIDQPAATQQIRFQVADANQMTLQMKMAYEQLRLRDIDLLPPDVQEGMVRSTHATVEAMTQMYRAGEEKRIYDQRALDLRYLEWQKKEYPAAASYYEEQIQLTKQKYAAEDASRAQRRLNEDYQMQQENLARLRQLYESTPLFQGMTRQLEQFQNDFEMVLGDIMTGEFKSWADEWNKIWKAMARNAAKYLTDELFQPVKDGWKKMTNDVVTEADKTGRPVAQGGFGLMWEGLKNIWGKITGSGAGPQKVASGFGAGEEASSALMAQAASAGSDASEASAAFAGDMSALASAAGTLTGSGAAITTSMTTITTSMTTAGSALLTSAGQLSAAATALAAAAARMGGGGGGGLGNLPDWGGSSDYTSGYDFDTSSIVGIGSGAGGYGPDYYAKGGHITKPTVGLVGEAGPELIVPLTKPTRAQQLLESVGLAYQPITKFAEGGLVGPPLSQMPQSIRDVADRNMTLPSLRPTGSFGPAGALTSLSSAQRTQALAAIGGSTSADAAKVDFRVWNGIVYVRTASGGWTPISAAQARAVYGIDPTVGGEGGGSDQGAGKGGRGSRGSDSWGGMTASQAKGVAQMGMMTGTLQGMLGFGALAALGYGVGLMGVEPGFDPYGGLRAADEQSVRDIQGAYAADAVAAQRAAVDQAIRDIEPETWGPTVAESMRSGGTPGGWGDSPTAPSDVTGGPKASESPMDATAPGGISMEGGRAPGGRAGETTDAPGFGGFGRGDPSFGNAPGMGGGPGGSTDIGGDRSTDTTGGSKGTEGSDVRARGGVRRATRKTHVTFGEGGEPETAVFIPEHMKQPGLQSEEEKAVIDTMIRALARLTGRDVEEIATPMAEGGVVTRKTLALIGEKGPEAVIPLRRPASATPVRSPAPVAPPHPSDTVTPGRASDTTIINVFREEDFQAAMAAAVARGSRVITNDIIAGLAGNRAIRRSIQRTS